MSKWPVRSELPPLPKLIPSLAPSRASAPAHDRPIGERSLGENVAGQVGNTDNGQSSVDEKLRSFWANLSLSLVSVLVTLVVIEVVLRFLPVSNGLRIQPVNEAEPYFHGEPNRSFVFSRGWNFSIVNRGRLNAQGFVNNQDYDSTSLGPLLALIGDSYIEALMVPFEQTVSGRLAGRVEGRGHVYSFAFSGAPLSQYLAWAKHAVEAYSASGLAIFVVSNDFDESIRRYAHKPGFYQYDKPNGTTEWVWVRRDYTPSPWRNLINASSLLQYLYRNVQATKIGQNLMEDLTTVVSCDPNKHRKCGPNRFEANVTADYRPERLDSSQQIVDHFLRDIVQVTGLQRERILFVVDGLRKRIYEGRPRADGNSYPAEMFSYFLAAARAQGFEAIDMHDVFEANFAMHRQRFEFPTDGHWNGYGHGVVADAVAKSKLYLDLFGEPN
jgi:hypothetical protein